MQTKFKAQLASFSTYGLLILTLSILLIWNISRENGATWFILALQCLPLMVLIPGLLKSNHRTFSWLCFIILLYFILAVMNAMQSLANWLDYVFLVSTVGIFLSAMMSSRWIRASNNESALKLN